MEKERLSAEEFGAAGNIDRGQQSGELAGHGGDRGNPYTGGNLRTADVGNEATYEDLEIDRQRVAEWRIRTFASRYDVTKHIDTGLNW